MNLDHILIGSHPETLRREVFIADDEKAELYYAFRNDRFNIPYTHAQLVEFHKSRNLPLVRYGQDKSTYEHKPKEQ